MAHTLLLADDSITIQRVIELTFADENIQVVAVGDGDQAIERLNTAPPDIVLADVGMPGRDGYEVARYIKQSPSLSHIPVVLLTGAFEPVDQAKAAEAGCDGVLAKPFEPQLVIGRVKELLARPRPAGGALDVAPAPAEAAAPVTSPMVGGPFEAPVSQAAQPVSASDYFDRLDHALASLSAPSLAPPKPAPSLSDLDWFISPPKPSGPPPADLLLAYAPPPVDFDSLTGGGTPTPTADLAATVQAPAASSLATLEFPAPASPQAIAGELRSQPALAWPAVTAPLALPPMADAFVALLAAEQNQPTPTTIPVWPTSPPASTIDPADFVEQVTRRVIEQLSDRVVRETVADIVSGVAERAVREEIERIKASIK